MQIGRQIIASLIAEQVAYHDYQTVKTQVQQAQDVQTFLQTKFTSADLYAWMQSELSGLYYQYYRFACDTARKAEQTMKQELMRPELDATQFIQFNYWDSGHQGLLSGEALYLDIKRMELAYHDNNKRELELTRHVSLRQLDPLALLTLQDHRLVHGHHPRMALRPRLPRPLHAPDQGTGSLHPVGRRALHQPELHADPAEQHDPRLAAARQRRVRARTPPRTTTASSTTSAPPTSSSPAAARTTAACSRPTCATSASCPFEGAGAISTWNLSLPAELRVVRLHDDLRRHPAHPLHRPRGGRPAGLRRRPRSSRACSTAAGTSGQALLFCLRYDFPTEWSAFVNGTGDFNVTLDKQFFPYSVQGPTNLTIDGLTLYTGNIASPSTPPALSSVAPLDQAALSALSAGLGGSTGQVQLSLPTDGTVLTRELTRQVFLVLQYHFTAS